MSPLTKHTGEVRRLVERLRDWWQQGHEIALLDRAELERIGADLGLTPRDLQELVDRGPEATQLLNRRLAAIGLTRGDMERVGAGVARDAERTCACCDHKTVCRSDLDAQTASHDWENYCPNAAGLQAARLLKGGRSPA